MNMAQMAAGAERVMAQEKAIVVVRTLLVRRRQHTTLFRQSAERIAACEAIIKRAPEEGKHLQQTLDFWIRQRGYHERQIAECGELDAALRATMSEADLRIAIDES